MEIGEVEFDEDNDDVARLTANSMPRCPGPSPSLKLR